MQRAEKSSRPRAGGSRAASWLALFLAALVLRVGYAWLATGPSAAPYSDAAGYDVLAWNLAQGHGFSPAPEAGPHYPTAFRPPVVPWITSLLYRATGHVFFAAVLLQCVIGALIPLLVVHLGAAVFGLGVGWLAGWLVACNPLLVFFSGYLLTETTFTATLVLALLATVQWIKTPRPGRALGVGIAWGLSALTRPTALALPALVGLWAWVPLGLTVTPRDRVRQVIFLLLGTLLVVAPWTLRNAIAFHALIPVTTGGGRALFDANNSLIWSDPERRGGAAAVVGQAPYAAEFHGLTEPQADAVAARRAREFLMSWVPEWPAMAAAKLGRFWRLTSEGSRGDNWRRGGGPLDRVTRLIDPLLIWSVVVLPFALWGVATIARGARRWFQLLGAFVIVYFTLLAVVYWGSLRMRVPIEPLLALLAAVGFEDARRRWRARASGLKVIPGLRGAAPRMPSSR